MAKVRFNPPLQWENWCGWLLAIWLCISPGPLKFGDDITATYVAVLTGIVLICTEMFTISPFRLWEEWINVCVGGWLIAAPWLLHVELIGKNQFRYRRGACRNLGAIQTLVRSDREAGCDR